MNKDTEAINQEEERVIEQLIPNYKTHMTGGREEEEVLSDEDSYKT